jgi:RNA polymerase sigma-70 factor, ECF subfamily
LSTEKGSAGQCLAESVETVLAVPVSAPRLPAPAAPAELPSFDRIYEEYFSLVWRTARRLGVPEGAVDDVVQDAFLVVHRRLDSFDGRVAFKHWLLGITARVVAGHRRTYRRKDSRAVPHAVDKHGGEMTPSSAPLPSEQAEQREALRLVVSLLDEMDSDKREVLVLTELEEMTAVEVAECLSLNINTVYARLRAARRAFDAAHARYRARTETRSP